MKDVNDINTRIMQVQRQISQLNLELISLERERSTILQQYTEKVYTQENKTLLRD